MALFIRPQIPTLVSSSHADLKSCTRNLSMTPPKSEILKNILVVCRLACAAASDLCLITGWLQSVLFGGRCLTNL